MTGEKQRKKGRTRRANEDQNSATRLKVAVSGKVEKNLARKTNMAANISVEEIIEMVTTDSLGDEDENEELIEDSDNFEDVMSQKLDELVEYAAEIQDDFDQETFKKFTLRYGLACFGICSTTYGNSMKKVLESNINCGSILRSECRLWLEMVNRKLGGRPKIRNPYLGECKRDIPVDVFIALKAAIKASNVVQFQEPNCYIGENRKGAVISLTSQRSVVMLFAILAGFGDAKVRNYFSRSLKGSRSGKSKLIVNRDKNFVFYYRYKQGKLVVEFHYGVWNASGYPLHT